MDGLKDCPCCGGTSFMQTMNDVFSEYEMDTNSSTKVRPTKVYRPAITYVAKCADCGLCTGEPSVSETAVREAWNKRASDK